MWLSSCLSICSDGSCLLIKSCASRASISQHIVDLQQSLMNMNMRTHTQASWPAAILWASSSSCFQLSIQPHLVRTMSWKPFLSLLLLLPSEASQYCRQRLVHSLIQFHCMRERFMFRTHQLSRGPAQFSSHYQFMNYWLSILGTVALCWPFGLGSCPFLWCL